MKFIGYEIKGVIEIILEPLIDKRGFFMRTFDNQIFKDNGIISNWVQENHSFSKEKGIVRGLHYQFPPFAEAKLIRVIRGEIFDVFVDLRIKSASFKKWSSLILSEDNKKMIFLPRGIAHGFCTLVDNCEIEYKMDNYYAPDKAGIIRWNDQDLKINWPFMNPVLSERDANAPTLAEFIEKYQGLKVD